jgi:hypothetical protein
MSCYHIFLAYKGLVQDHCPYSPHSQSKADKQRHMLIFHSIENEANLTTQHEGEPIRIPLMKFFKQIKPYFFFIFSCPDG